MQHHIFLSYSRQDLQIMQHVRDDLRAAGLEVWTDEGIEPGSISWKEAIEKSIRETGMVVVLLSPAANDSRWVQREIDYAETLYKPILPLLIDGNVRDAIPFALAGSQFIDMRYDYHNGLSSLIWNCYKFLPGAALPTIRARPATPTYTSPGIRRKRKKQHIQHLIASFLIMSLALLVIVSIFVLRSAGEASGEEVSDNNITLIYNKDTLAIHNTSSEIISLDDIYFELDSEKPVIFEADDWITQSLDNGRCVQVWDIRFRYLSAPDVCRSRVAYRASINIFWVSNNERVNFLVKREDDVIGSCLTINGLSEDTLSCSIAL